MANRNCTEVASLPDDVLGRPRRSESFADLMSQVSASRMQVFDEEAKIRRELEASRREPLRDRQRQVPKAKSTGAIHQKPFGVARAVGDYFGMPGTLKQKDLTSWEQKKAVSPERSWPPSSMTNVQKRPGGLRGSESPSVSFQAGTLRLPKPDKENSTDMYTDHRNNYYQPSRHVKMDDDGMVLTPVRTSSAPTTPVKQRRPESSERRALIPANKTSPNFMPGRKMPHMGAECDEDRELELLHARRRRLLNELNRTQLSLWEIESSAHDGSSQGSSRVTPGGGGGAPIRIRSTPSAGGPFAGKRSNFSRKNADEEFKSLNRHAGDSYSYLGPGSDGPALQEIHPLWS